MSISPRDARIPASEETFSCKSGSARKNPAVNVPIGGIAAIAYVDISTGESVFIGAHGEDIRPGVKILLVSTS
jgi:hypothetical protein